MTVSKSLRWPAAAAACVATAAALLTASGGAAAHGGSEALPDSKAAPTAAATVAQATFNSGSGPDFLGVSVSTRGNLLRFESPAGQDALFPDSEGYVLCTGTNDDVLAEDTGGAAEAHLGPATIVQPAATAFPLTVVRRTLDGRLEVKQVWAKPSASVKEVTVTMTVKNLSTSPIGDVLLARTADVDNGSSSSDLGALSADAAWQFDDLRAGPDAAGLGTQLLAGSLKVLHGPNLEPRTDWVATGRHECRGVSVATPVGTGTDLALRMVYALDSLLPGKSKTVRFTYRRM